MLETIFLIVCLLMALTVHEAAHAWAADKLGDPTAKNAGRLTLNPLAHLDPMGTLALIFIHIGWGKPVPVNPNNLKHRARDNFLIALAGPFTNLLTALLAAVVLRFTGNIPILASFLSTFIILDIFLMVFNLIPVPPLDGSKIWHLFLSDEAYYTLEQFGPYILIAVLLFSYSGGGFLFTFVENLAQKIISLIT